MPFDQKDKDSVVHPLPDITATAPTNFEDFEAVTDALVSLSASTSDTAGRPLPPSMIEVEPEAVQPAHLQEEKELLDSVPTVPETGKWEPCACAEELRGGNQTPNQRG
ncbi:Fc.00g063350.m01.CDS01 [Cosmosporella sp. VM-42]